MKIKILLFALVFIFLTACTATENEIVIELQFKDGERFTFRTPIGVVFEEVDYYAIGEHGKYHFVTGDEWANEYMMQLIEVSEEAVKFVKKWLGHEGDDLIDFVYGNMLYDPPTNPYSRIQKLWGGGNAFDGVIFINVQEEYMPAIIAHEAVHTILRSQERETNFPLSPADSWLGGAQFFEEGLANVIDYLFFLETEHVYGTFYGTDKQTTESHIHKEALIMLDFFDNFEDEKEHGLIYPQLMSYETAASFIYYLLEYKGTK
ncbi:MAG: hypothetical protein FWE60_02720, partial [Oscillospiraceae bacterium]|nr:hypothetical protein [Oscillospiraceae bacterium]